MIGEEVFSLSALKTRTTVRLRLCASEKPERSWFLNNANGRYPGIINEINCIKKDQSLIHSTKTSSILGIVALTFAGVRRARGSREKTFSGSYFA